MKSKNMNTVQKIILEMTAEEIKFSDLAFNISQEFHKILENKDINQSDLATRLGISEASISKMLSIDANLTVKTIAKLLTALNADLDIKIIDTKNKWIEASHENKSSCSIDTYTPKDISWSKSYKFVQNQNIPAKATDYDSAA